MDMPIQTTTAPPAPDDDVGVIDVAIDFHSDGSLTILQADGTELAIRLTRREALDLARGLLQYANPAAYHAMTQPGGHA